MPHPRIDGANRRRQAGTAIGENQAQASALQSAPVQILEQRLPVGLAFALAAQESQQVPTPVATYAIGDQHLHLLASGRSPHSQAYPVQEKIDVIVTQPRLMKLPHRLIQIPCQLRHRLRAYRFSGHGRHYPTHLPRADPAQKRLPDQQRDLLRPPLKTPQPHRQKALLTRTRDAQPNRPEARHEIPLVIPVAVNSPFPASPLIASPTREAVPLPLRLQLEKLLPRLPGLPIEIAPETLFHLR